MLTADFLKVFLSNEMERMSFYVSDESLSMSFGACATLLAILREMEEISTSDYWDKTKDLYSKYQSLRNRC